MGRPREVWPMGLAATMNILQIKQGRVEGGTPAWGHDAVAARQVCVSREKVGALFRLLF